jgi:hypothetical protein
VDAEGRPLPPDTHPLFLHPDCPPRRQKRSADGEADARAFYALQAFGQDLFLELLPDDSFIGGELIVEHMDVNHSWVEAGEVEQGRHCFFSGGLRGHADGAVSVSVCHHMVRRYSSLLDFSCQDFFTPR